MRYGIICSVSHLLLGIEGVAKAASPDLWLEENATKRKLVERVADSRDRVCPPESPSHGPSTCRGPVREGRRRTEGEALSAASWLSGRAVSEPECPGGPEGLTDPGGGLPALRSLPQHPRAGVAEWAKQLKIAGEEDAVSVRGDNCKQVGARNILQLRSKVEGPSSPH